MSLFLTTTERYWIELSLILSLSAYKERWTRPDGTFEGSDEHVAMFTELIQRMRIPDSE